MNVKNKAEINWNNTNTSALSSLKQFISVIETTEASSVVRPRYEAFSFLCTSRFDEPLFYVHPEISETPSMKPAYQAMAEMYDNHLANSCLDLSLLWRRNHAELKASLEKYPDAISKEGSHS